MVKSEGTQKEIPTVVGWDLKKLLWELRVSKDRLETLGEIVKYSTGDTSDAVDKIKNKAEKSKADGVHIRVFPYTTAGNPNKHFCVYGIMYRIKQRA